MAKASWTPRRALHFPKQDTRRRYVSYERDLWLLAHVRMPFLRRMRSAQMSKHEWLLTTPLRKRQYTLQFHHWEYFKKSSRRRPQHTYTHRPDFQDRPAPTLPAPEPLSEEPESDIVQGDSESVHTPWLHENEAQSTEHTPIPQGSVTKGRVTIAESLALLHQPIGSTPPVVGEYRNKLSHCRTNAGFNLEVLPEMLFDGTSTLSPSMPQDTPVYNLLTTIAEESQPPSLSGTGRLPAVSANSTDTLSLSSSESGDNGLHVLMDVDPFVYAAVTGHRQLGFETRH